MLNSHKILLVHPLGYKASAAGKDISRVANIMPPLGLASIAAYLEQRAASRPARGAWVETSRRLAM